MSPAQYNEINCPFCGRIVRDSDKFCIFCGKRLQKRIQNVESKKISKKERKDLEDEVDKDLDSKKSDISEEDESESDDESSDDEKKDSKKKKDKDESKKGKNEEPSVEPDPEIDEKIKHQLETKMEISLLQDKKKKLKSKLDELTDNLDEEKYEWDIHYQKKIQLKLNALKELKNELLAKEDELRENLNGSFRVDVLKEEIALKREQLIELKRSYKRKKVKKDVYKQLKQEYVDGYEQLTDELDLLHRQMTKWVAEEKAMKNRFESKIRLLEGRLNSKQISEDEFNKEKLEIMKEIRMKENAISILEDYLKKEKRKWF